MKIVRIDRNSAKPGIKVVRVNHWEGKVRIQRLVEADEGTDVYLGALFFEKGARTDPHVHERGQVLLITKGKAIVATETARRVLSAGEIAITPAGVWHWHGATKISSACQISIRPSVGGVNWKVDEKNWPTPVVQN